MKVSLTILILIAAFLTACKDDVNFAATPSSEQSQNVNPDPVGDLGPRVNFLKRPDDHKLGKSTMALFKVIKGDFEIRDVKCAIDNVLISCDWLKGIVPLIKFSLGNHKIEVIAFDEAGQKGSESAQWTVFQGFEKVEEDFEVNEQNSKTDILFVIDNSSSMYAEQKEISKRFDKFVHQIKDLDWQIGITTTDPRTNQVWSDGRLDPFQRGLYYLTPSLGVENAQALFADKVRRRESGWDTEEGIKATYRAIERSMNPRNEVDRALASFMREKSALAIVLVSDEDESNNNIKNRGSELIKLVQQKWGTNKVFQFNSIITHTQECLRGDGLSMGYAYEQLSMDTNGIVGDICAKNYSKILKDIGEGVANLVKVYKLSCVPQDINSDGKIDLKIELKTAGKVPGYALDKNEILFDEALAPGSYMLDYYCLEN